jgi:hypothetical protein
VSKRRDTILDSYVYTRAAASDDVAARLADCHNALTARVHDDDTPQSVRHAAEIGAAMLTIHEEELG